MKHYAAIWILVAVVVATLILTSCNFRDGSGSAQPGYVEIDVDHPKRPKAPSYRAPKAPKAPAYRAPSRRR
ncbi:hypothetical protein ACQEVG_32780 [Streptomyces sp. CA-135486]|uniref:hypothetical protein n=1 Tax=Streptomyces sp. CA-135486 TaxID=3240049 RepID=UPI003D8F25F1